MLRPGLRLEHKLINPHAQDISMIKFVVAGVLWAAMLSAQAVTPGERITRVAGCIGCHHETVNLHN